MKKVAFIDGDINIRYIESMIIPDIQRIGGVWSVSNNLVIPMIERLPDAMTHATLCTKIFLEYVNCETELFFIDIWHANESKASLNNLLLALHWCFEHKIDLVNLSIGTTSVLDVPCIFNVINKLLAENIIIVAACSNDNKLTFPASFDNVISVKLIENKGKKAGWIFRENSIDRIDVYGYIENDAIEHNGLHYDLSCGNSLVTPMISAKICNLLSEGHDSLKKIRQKLKETSDMHCTQQHEDIYNKYFEENIEIPIILILTDNANRNEIHKLAEKILLKFSECHYSGICLSEQAKTNMEEKTLNLMDFNQYHPLKKLKFYAHYCRVDYLLVESSKTFLFENFSINDFDLIIHLPQQSFHEKKNENLQWIEFSENEGFDIFFDKIYTSLSQKY